MRAILDEASQVVEYSHRLEQKSRELEAASAELRTANERLKELDRMKDDFISTITHELRTPLTSIRAFSEILLDDPDLARDKRIRFITIITKETERLSRLINQVLDVAKIESGRAEWNVGRVDVREVVADAVAEMSQLAKENGTALAVHAPQHLPPVSADLDRVVQVLLNLLSNAVKFCERGRGRVDVTLSERDGYVRVDVRDNGPGHRRRAPRADLREVPPGRRHADREAGGQRPRPAHQPADRRASRRQAVGREPPRRRRVLLVHAAGMQRRAGARRMSEQRRIGCRSAC